MRNLTFLAAPAAKLAAASFRRAFMEKTASWSVVIEECRTRSEAAALLSAKKSHAFVVSAPFRRAVFEAGKVQGASARLAQGADILYRGGKNTLAVSQYARVAIDLALARGGDQAVIKDCHGITYYGGKREMTAKNTRVKARVKAEALREYITVNDKIFVMGHTLTDVDSFGAAIGICRAANALGKKANVVINEVSASLRPLYNMYIDNPSYPDDLFLTSEQALNLADENSMVVVVDTNRPKMVECEELLYLAKTIVVLDHHRQSSEVISNAVLSYVEPYASSACEMVAEVLQYIADGIRMKSAEADAMYAGIVIDTNNFTNQTGVRTFEAAAFLRRNGADVTRVRKLFRDDMQDYKARAAAISSAEIYREAFSIGVCPSEGLPSPTIVCAQAANELLEIKGIKASVVMTEYHGLIYLSARSIDEVNVQVMMEKLGGGGHRTIAGAQLSGISMEEAKDRVKAVIDEMLQKGDIS